MTKAFVLVLCVLATAAAQETVIRSSVTFVAAGSVYVGSGRNQGLGDTATAIVRRGGAMITTLRLTAASSRSSAWVADSAVQSVLVGDSVVIRVPAVLVPEVAAVDTQRSASQRTMLSTEYRPSERVIRPAPWVEVVGRVGLQFFGSAFDESALNIAQPGVVLSVRSTARDIPLRLDLYANMREMARGATPLFSARSSASSRLYRITLEYDDKTNIVTAGRMTVPMAPTIGILDGLTVARRVGNFTAGLGAGLQPAPDLLGTDANRRKVMAFVLYRPPGWSSASASAAYAKTWYQGASEREVVSTSAGAALSERVSVWTSVDVDLRVTQSGIHRMDPSLSLLLCTASWRMTDYFSLSGGLDASRSVLPYSFAKFIPDSMADRTLRSGLNISGSLFLAGGISMMTSVAPRMLGGEFSGEYSSSTSIAMANVMNSGTSVRVYGLLSESSMTLGRGYGATVSGNALTVDWSGRVQQFHYRLKQSGTLNTGTTLGIDTMVPILRPLTLLVSLDLVRGYGSTSRSIFSELSYRF